MYVIEASRSTPLSVDNITERLAIEIFLRNSGSSVVDNPLLIHKTHGTCHELVHNYVLTSIFGGSFREQANVAKTRVLRSPRTAREGGTQSAPN